MAGCGDGRHRHGDRSKYGACVSDSRRQASEDSQGHSRRGNTHGRSESLGGSGHRGRGGGRRPINNVERMVCVCGCGTYALQ